jgi:TATA-box binding protein (TBP) (component of TFIID and TFIIIB)
MKKVFFIIMTMLITCNISFAQTSVEIIRERQWLVKQAKKELEAKVSKDIRKEAKRLKKGGWVVSPGALPLEKQLERSYLMQYEYDENLFPKYIMASAQSIGENYDAAKNTATSLAKTNLAEQIQTEVTVLIENIVTNQQLAAEDALSLTETIKTSKSLINQSIGHVVTVVECYRVLDNKNREVLIRIAYDGKMAKEAAKKVLRQELERKGEKLRKELDQALGE